MDTKTGNSLTSYQAMWTLTLFAIAFVLFYMQRRKNFQYFKNMGIPGPEPSVWFGNLVEIIYKTPLKCHKEWIDKYGKIVGYYFGTKPVILTTDVDLLKKVQVSEFHKFINRPDTFRGPTSQNSKKPARSNEGFSQHLVLMRDKKWKDTRSIITPAFTTAKMKQMAPLIGNAMESFLSNLEKKSAKGNSFDIYEMYQGLTMDVIGRTAFGIQTNCQNDPNDPLLRSSRVLFSGDIKSRLIILAGSFRSFQRFWNYVARLKLIITTKGHNPIAEIIKTVKQVIATRRSVQGSKRPDLLQSMIDAEIDESTKVTSDDLTAKDDIDLQEQKTEASIPKREKLLRRMTDAEVLDNSILFFLAGYETTSTALAFTTHLLIHHPDVQDKVRKEIQQLLEKEGELDYYPVNKLQYLDQVLNESLRYYPPIYLFVARECGEDTQYGNMCIEKGMTVQVPTYNLHRDQDYWEDADQFKPERFSPENKSKINPLAFQAFGAGPRNCVGMRFAQMEAKMALAKILSKYKLEICSESDSEPITLKINVAVINPKKGVWLKAVPL